jgi:hypothetical protein
LTTLEPGGKPSSQREGDFLPPAKQISLKYEFEYQLIIYSTS